MPRPFSKENSEVTPGENNGERIQARSIAPHSGHISMQNRPTQVQEMVRE